ncbi:hypothetical protein RI367_002002 [Sorochytrium milnesiophthora]
MLSFTAAVALVVALLTATSVAADDSSDTPMIQVPDPCAAPSDSSYNLPLHIAAIFIMFAVSMFATGLPIASTKYPFLRKIITPLTLSFARFFGSGVILSTAFIHMLLPAEDSFNSGCVAPAWKSYGGFAGVFCLTGVFFMALLDFAVGLHRRNRAAARAAERGSEDSIELEKTRQNNQTHEHEHLHAHGHHDHNCGEDLLVDLVAGEEHEKRKTGLFTLEMAIAVHSVFIGVTLGLTHGSEFNSLLAAICFHQFFEGFALGAVAVPLNLSRKALATLMLMFSCTTTFGCAIGVIVSAVSQGNINGPTPTVIIAIMDSLCAGILVYTALLDVLVPELRDDRLFKQRPFIRTACFFMFILGLATMAVIGIWA